MQCCVRLTVCSLQELLAGAQDKADTFEDDSDFEAQKGALHVEDALFIELMGPCRRR